MKEIGDLLRRQREERGVSLADAQAATKIRRRYLEALEAGEELSYPGEVYYRGFMKTYAAFLGLDGAAVVAKYRALKDAMERDAATPEEGAIPEQAQAAPPEPAATVPAPTVESLNEPAQQEFALPRDLAGRRRGAGGSTTRERARRKKSGRQMMVMALALAVAGLVYTQGFWRVASQPENPPAGQAAQQQPAEQQPSQKQAEPSQPAVSPQQPPEQPAPPAQPPSVQPPQQPQGDGEDQPRVFEYTREEKSKYLTAISARIDSVDLVGEVRGGQCWVRVEADGKLLQESMLEPGTYTWQARQQLYIRVGAPATMRLRLNGLDLGPAGAQGPAKDFAISVSR
ncbi:MAG: DUF4115 domain-containing protein [Firmicutes bacterium]|nr:DUF4115 domain-containing protein [Bacillota bacterium]